MSKNQESYFRTSQGPLLTIPSGAIITKHNRTYIICITIRQGGHSKFWGNSSTFQYTFQYTF